MHRTAQPRRTRTIQSSDVMCDDGDSLPSSSTCEGLKLRSCKDKCLLERFSFFPPLFFRVDYLCASFFVFGIEKSAIREASAASASSSHQRIRSVGDKQTICFACEIASEVHRPRERARESARDERRRARGNIQFGCYKHNSLCFRVLRDMLCFLQERKKKECLTSEQSFLLFSFKVWRRAMRRRCLRASVPFAHCSCTHDDQQRMLIGGNFNYFCRGQKMAGPFFIPSARS